MKYMVKFTSLFFNILSEKLITNTPISIKAMKNSVYILRHTQKLIQIVASFVCSFASIISFSVNELWRPSLCPFGWSHSVLLSCGKCRFLLSDLKRKTLAQSENKGGKCTVNTKEHSQMLYRPTPLKLILFIQ